MDGNLRDLIEGIGIVSFAVTGMIVANNHGVNKIGTLLVALPAGLGSGIGADLKRQFEFVQSEWVNEGIFIGASAEKDPICGPNDGTGVFTIPKQPIRQRLQGLSLFVTNRGGDYFFMPGLRALRWLADAEYVAEAGGGAER